MLVNRVHKPYHCRICGSSSQIKVCKCQKAYYCSKNCQKIDWKMHKAECYNVVEYSTSNRGSASKNDPSSSSQCKQQNSELQVPSTMDDLPQQSFIYDREGQHESAFSTTQYQDIESDTNTDSQQTSTSCNASDDFEQNLFNSLLFSVDEGTEQEILRNLDINDEELLQACNLDDTESSFGLDDQLLTDNKESQQPIDQFDEEIFNQIQRKKSFEYQPETQKLLKETRENLEKELSMFREINLSSESNSQQQLHQNEEVVHYNSSADVTKVMQFKQNNPKYRADAKLDDRLLIRGFEDQEAIEEMSANVVRDMNEFGVCVLDNFLGEDKGQKVLNEVKNMYNAGFFKDGQLVANRRTNKHIRGDKITWINGTEDGVSHIKHLMNQVDAVIMMANRMNNNGKVGQYKIRERTKAMVACYEGKGSHYVKHVDNPNRDGRCITCIYYLNADWDVRENGGLLRIFPDGWEDRVADIEPLFDRITFFWSDRRNPHEVQPAHKTRYAITLWYFDAHERADAVKRYQKECENLRKKVV